jgi:L-ascorbate metabolism protein UlaG (beta-lactamase superfamily)
MKQATNYRDGKFYNTEPTTVMKPGAFWPTLYQYLFKGRKERVPRRALPVVAMSGYAHTTASEDLRFAWLGHAGVLLELEGKRILIDPVFSRRASLFQWAGPKRFQPSPLQAGDLPALDAVLISHDHYDHLDRATIHGLADKTAGFHVPLGLARILEGWGIPPANIHEYAWWDEQTLNGITLTAAPARHFSGRGLFNRFGTLWCSWVVADRRYRIYHSGDTGMTSQFQRIGAACGPFDLAFIKMAAYSDSWPDIHLNPEQATVALVDLRGKRMVPIHWAVFDLSVHSWYEPIERLVKAAGDSRAHILTPRMGELVDPHTYENTFWWRPLMLDGRDRNQEHPCRSFSKQHGSK